MKHHAIQTRLNRDAFGRIKATTATMTYADGRPAERERVPYQGLGSDQAHTDAARRLINSVNWDGAYMPAPLTKDVWVWVPTDSSLATTPSKWVGVHVSA
jgi:hypothetical protein